MAIKATNQAAKFLERAQKVLREDIRKCMREVLENPQLGKQLTGNLSGKRSIRISSKVISQPVVMIYQKSGDDLIVWRLDFRGNVYRF